MINLQCNLFPPRSRPGGERYVHLLFSLIFAAHTASILRTPHNYLFPDQFFDIFRFRHRTDRTFFHCDQCCTCIRICQNLFNFASSRLSRPYFNTPLIEHPQNVSPAPVVSIAFTVNPGCSTRKFFIVGSASFFFPSSGR